MNKNIYKALYLSSLLFCAVVKAETQSIVVSATELDIEAEELNYDFATVTITGPNDYRYQAQLDAKDSQLDFERLGHLAEGHYKYEILYTKNNGIEKVSDRKTGRDNVYRNVGEVVTHWGHFNILNGEFVDAQSETEPPFISNN
ncbi:hypothetical protein [Shewanella goraebulensis]|uniref:hypothetical protein n=1 Tax=Shewanella goraebulensis TaxID=3050637 RepID=UPI00254E5178|nr:hypothetical protein [Shewanella goraebulensis]